MEDYIGHICLQIYKLPLAYLSLDLGHLLSIVHRVHEGSPLLETQAIEVMYYMP